jgi:hypothetical protein
MQNNQQNYLDEKGQVVCYERLDEEQAMDRQLGGAVIAGGLAGLFLAGLVVRILAAVGAAIAVTTSKGNKPPRTLLIYTYETKTSHEKFCCS